jgi:hypothetical protein
MTGIVRLLGNAAGWLACATLLGLDAAATASAW